MPNGSAASRNGRPKPVSSSTMPPASIPAATSSSVRSVRTTPELNSRAGSPHHSAAALGLTNLVAMDLQGLPEPDISVQDWDSKGLDKGYSELRSADKRNETGILRDLLEKNGLLQQNYLSGPTDELVESLPRPSPLSRSLSSLDSPAISATSTANCTPEVEFAPNGDDGYMPLLDSTPSRPRPRAFTLSHSAFGSFGTFPSTARAGPLAPPTIWSRIKLFFLQLLANIASAAFLAFIVIWALSSRGWNGLKRKIRGEQEQRKQRTWDTQEARRKYENEKVVKDIQYYALNCGFDVIEQTIATKDGYLLKMFRVECLKNGAGKIHSDGRKGFPILIQHGLFQSCGSFITSEERSLAFWLAEHGGYQVYLGNNRGVFDMGHQRLKRSDPRFWDYNIKELALYDLPAMVDHVRRDTGYDKIAFIGHSQGNATMFCSLAQGMVPELGEKLSLFIALAPAVYAGPLTTGFPFGTLKSMKWKTWRKWFGVLDFIPLMRISYNVTPSKPFGLLGYQMFAFLFNWTDRNWLLRRKPKMFRFTPSPVSSASIFWWTGYGGFSTRGCVLDPSVDKWFDARFPPLSIHHGGLDYLVLTEPLLERLQTHEKDVRVVRVQKLDEGEHCDFFWHIDAVELCFHSFLEDIEKTRPRYPEERKSSSNSSAANGSNGAAAGTRLKSAMKASGKQANGNVVANGRAGSDSVKRIDKADEHE